MTVRDVAAYLRIHSSTVYRLLKNKAIPSFKVGADWRFSLADIEAWSASLSLTGNTATTGQEGQPARRRRKR